MKHLSFLVAVLLTAFFTFSSSFAQVFGLNGYLDSYISIDNDRSYSFQEFNEYRPFSIVNGHKDQVGLNIAQLSANVDGDNYYGLMTLQYGDIPIQAWGGSAPVIQEAYAGIKFNRKFSFDAGYFTTHIGGELLLPKDNYLSSHSLSTYMEPFYHSGIRAHYQATDNLKFSLLILNSMWYFQENNENKTFGWLAAYSNDKFSIGYTGAVGNERDGSPNNAQLEMYHDVTFEITSFDKLLLKGQFDMHMLNAPNNSEADNMSTVSISAEAKYQLVQKWAIAGRFAYLMNEDGMELAPPVNALGLTAGVEYKPSSNTYMRLEGRMLSFDEGENAEGKVFNLGDEPSTSRMELMFNIGIMFDFLSK